MKGKVACFGALLCVASACDGGTDISGVVRDANGEPLSGVLVVLRYEERPEVDHADSTWTGPGGTFAVGFLHEAFNVALSLSASKPGHVTYRREFGSNEAVADSIQAVEYRITLATDTIR